MKKLLLATLTLVAFTTACYAGANDLLVKNLKNAIKYVSSASWKTTAEYKEAAFNFDGKKTRAFFDPETDALIGFSIEQSMDELPAGTQASVDKKFSGWAITDRIMFIDADGNSKYYIQVTNGKHSLALSVSDKGKASIYAQMP